ncbi:MAG: helix-turn-helix transcriptional regulator, partial [Oribacterium sp.]|nr:helix-turn-helix transcriptional regulator [Oribacterium sp.]
SYKNLSRLMNNEVISIRLETIDRLTNALQCSPGDLFEKIEENGK